MSAQIALSYCENCKDNDKITTVCVSCDKSLCQKCLSNHQGVCEPAASKPHKENPGTQSLAILLDSVQISDLQNTKQSPIFSIGITNTFEIWVYRTSHIQKLSESGSLLANILISNSKETSYAARCLCIMGDDTVLFSSDTSLCCVKEHRSVFLQSVLRNFKTNRVYGITLASDGTIWLCLHGNLNIVHLTPQGDILLLHERSSSVDADWFPLRIQEIQPGKIVLLCDKYLIFYNSSKAGLQCENVLELASPYADMICDEHGHILLALLNRKQLTVLSSIGKTLRQLSLGAYITGKLQSISVDRTSRLWISTDNGEIGVGHYLQEGIIMQTPL